MIQDSPSREVQSVQTAFTIIQHLQNLDGATMNELATRLDVAKSTVHNYLQTLISLGYVVEHEGTYRPGLRLLTHGMAARNSLSVRETVSASLDEVSQNLSLAAWWVVEEYGRGIFVDGELPGGGEMIYGRTGKRVYLHTDALGKSILAGLSSDYVSQIIDYHGLPAYTRETTTDPAELRQELNEIRERGYAVSDGEAALGVQSVGVAFKGHSRTHAIGVFGYSHDVTGLMQDHDIPAVLEKSARTIEEAVE